MVKLEEIFKDDNLILAVFLFSPESLTNVKNLKYTFYFLLRDYSYKQSLIDIYNDKIKMVFSQEFNIEFLTGKTLEERYEIFSKSRLIYTSSYEEVHKLIDNTVKKYLGVSSRKNLDLEVYKKRQSYKDEPEDKMLTEMIIIVGLLSSVFAFVVVFFLFGISSALRIVICIIGVFTFIYILFGLIYGSTSKLLNSDIFSFYTGGKGKKFEDTYSQARSYKMKKQYEDAVKEYERAIEVNPDEFEPRYQLAELYYELKNYQKALEVYENAVGKTPNREVAANIMQRMAEICINNTDNVEKGKLLLVRIINDYKDTRVVERARSLLRISSRYENN